MKILNSVIHNGAPKTGSAVGKTSMLLSYCNGRFPQDYIPTVFDNYSANIKLGDDIVQLAFWLVEALDFETFVTAIAGTLLDKRTTTDCDL
jgi:hypothetical protein